MTYQGQTSFTSADGMHDVLENTALSGDPVSPANTVAVYEWPDCYHNSLHLQGIKNAGTRLRVRVERVSYATSMKHHEKSLGS